MRVLLAAAPSANAIARLLDDDVFAPDVLVADVTRCLARTVRDHDIEPAQDAFRSAPIEYVPVWPHADRIWKLRHTVSAYDACYVVVAEALGCPLVTTDQRLGRTPDLTVPVIAVPH